MLDIKEQLWLTAYMSGELWEPLEGAGGGLLEEETLRQGA